MKNIYSVIVLLMITILPLSAQRQMEKLDRGIVAVKNNTGVFVSWRIFGNDDKNVEFNLYRNDELVNTAPLKKLSNYLDTKGKVTDEYKVDVLVNGQVVETSKTCKPWGQQYLTVQLDRPAGGVTPPSYFDNRSSSNRETIPYPDGEAYTYTPNDMSVADLDGDGEYELIVKWDPSNSRDNSHSGMTGPVFIDAYKLDGTKLWRIELGKNIRAGAHYTQFMVYDFDGDGIAELVCKTAPGTVDGLGNNVIMGSDNPNADYRNAAMNSNNGYVLNGPEYLTLFDGRTGGELHTVPYKPARGTTLKATWGDDYGNRVDRFLACVAYLDGVRPSVVMCRGYYSRATLAAYDVVDKKLVERWFYDSGTSASKNNAFGQGNHSIAVGDVDDDGFDEIVYGGAAIDHDGKLLYNTQTGHGDAGHLSDMDPDRPGLEWFQPHEEKTSPYGFEFRDAGSGVILFGEQTGKDIGRGLAADIDPSKRGFEYWTTASSNVYNCQTGEVISTRRPSVNFRIYWDGDLQDELLDGNKITKWSTSKISTLLTMSGCSSSNSTKSTPNLSADILGDWREEVILYESNDPSKIRIYTTTTATTHGLYTLMHDPVYRMSIAWQNVAYNQPPHLGFYIGDGLDNIPYPDMFTPTPLGIENNATESSLCNAYINRGSLQINSNDIIKSVSIYNLSGMLINRYDNIGQTTFTESIYNNNDKVLIVRVLTDGGVKTFKLMNR